MPLLLEMGPGVVCQLPGKEDGDVMCFQTFYETYPESYLPCGNLTTGFQLFPPIHSPSHVSPATLHAILTTQPHTFPFPVSTLHLSCVLHHLALSRIILHHPCV